jgi:hypothetical protein
MPEHHSVTGKRPTARPQRTSKRARAARLPLPFNQRETCSIRAASEASGLGRSKIYQMIAAGRLKTVKVDKRHLVVIASLLELLRA